MASVGAGLFRRLKIGAAIIAAGATIVAGLALASIYFPFPGRSRILGEIVAGLVFLVGVAATSFTDPRLAR